jgi:two-component sensor histidine kinase
MMDIPLEKLLQAIYRATKKTIHHRHKNLLQALETVLIIPLELSSL